VLIRELLLPVVVFDVVLLPPINDLVVPPLLLEDELSRFPPNTRKLIGMGGIMFYIENGASLN
jgi:hypothetical protein